MNYFLILIILVLGGGSFYEYDFQNSRHTGDEQRLTDMTARVSTLNEQNMRLTAINAQETKAATDAQTQLSDLTTKLQAAQAALAQEKQNEVAAQQPPAVAPAPNPMPTPGTNDLSTIATTDGKVYANSQLMKVKTDGIVVSYSGGITQVPFTMMQPELQKRFGFDPKTALTLTPDQVAAEEQKRIATGSTAGN